MPLVYCISYTMAYFGPNAEIMGNVKNNSWQYYSVENIEDTMYWNGIMILVDLGSTTTTFLLLYLCCKVNVLKMFLQMHNQVWYMLAIQQGYIIAEVSFQII